MIDIKKIIRQRELVETKLLARGYNKSLDELIALYEKRNILQKKEDELRHQKKEKSTFMRYQEISEEMRIEMRNISQEIDKVAKEAKNIDSKITTSLLEIPNLILDDVPISDRKEDSIKVYSFGKVNEFEFPISDHVSLAKNLRLIDFERATKMAGSSFPLYFSKGAILEWSLINFMINYQISSGFNFVLPPILNNTRSLTISGNLPKFADQIYSCKDDDLHLIPTSEVPLTAFFSDELVNLDNGPIRLMAYTPNFRREAGSYGKRDQGLMRMHQFNKIETYSICQPSQSKEELEFLVENARGILEKLGLHYRIANLPSCDLAQQSAKTYDIEIWLPFQKRYSEVSSASNCTDYQARRANIRFKLESDKGYVHTLNCSGLATPRVMVALLETYQTKDGGVIVPEVLREFTHFDEITLS